MLSDKVPPVPPAAAAEWASRISGWFPGLGTPASRRLLSSPTASPPGRLTCEWPGLPARVVRCLGREQAFEVLDVKIGGVDEGRRRLQDEYVEWRTVRDEAGQLIRVEFTTELPESWAFLAAHAPQVALATVAAMAGEDAVDPVELFGDCDPFHSRTTARDREEAFTERMLSPLAGPYNNGDRAICCMVHPTNTLAALVALASAAVLLRQVSDAAGTPRPCVAGHDLLPCLGDAAVAGRASDPLIAERFAALAWEGRSVAFAEPVGVYIVGMQAGRLRTPDGAVVGSDWFHFGRGAASDDGLVRWQRLTVEAPPGQPHVLGDVVDVATEEPIRHGAQLAELVQIGLHLAVGPPGAIPCDDFEPARAKDSPEDCADVLRHADELRHE